MEIIYAMKRLKELCRMTKSCGDCEFNSDKVAGCPFCVAPRNLLDETIESMSNLQLGFHKDD